MDMAFSDWLPHAQCVLDQPPQIVWPHVLRWDEWIRDYRLEHLTGQKDAVGERKRVSLLDEAGNVSGSFHVQVAALVPNTRLAYRILPFEKPAFGFERVQGYELFNLYDLGAKTLLMYQTIASVETSLMPQEQFATHVSNALQAGGGAWNEKYWPELRRRLASKS